MRRALACFKAGLDGQKMPAKVDRSNGKVIAIASSIGAGASVVSFVAGHWVSTWRHAPDANTEE